MGHFVKPERKRIPILEGEQWVEVKARLSYGEQQYLTGVGITSIKTKPGADSELGLDWSIYNIAKLSTWLLDWSLCDDDDRRVKVNRESIADLDPAVAEEIVAAIDKHVEDLEEEKKLKSGKSTLETK